MRTPEEIKKGLEYCSEKAERKTNCSECIYFNDPRGWCSTTITRDALAYIQQLEARMEALADEALTYIQQLEAQHPRWISANDRLPERGITRCVIAIKLGNGLKGTLCARYNADLKSWSGWYNDKITSEVTHWMPLPQPPEEE